MAKMRIDWNDAYATIANAAMDAAPVCGLTHNFYKYPARFSPTFAAAAIRCLSHPSDIVLDPYMGGGTTVVEALAAGRTVIGNDLNSLAVFIAKVKTTPVTKSEAKALRHWASEVVPNFKYDIPSHELSDFVDQVKTRNLSIARARFIKKAVAVALASLPSLPTTTAQDFARCAVLRAGQWALDGRVRHTSLADFRKKLSETVCEMLVDIESFIRDVKNRNPISLVRNTGATRKTRKARSLTVEQFHVLLKELQEPFATMALIAVCLGLRISEVLALKWSDVDWLNARLSVQRGIVNQKVDDVKTHGSARSFNLSAELLDRLKAWKQLSEFTEPEVWIFASPFKIGRLPWSYTAVLRELTRASAAAGIGHVTSHAFRHTYRSWLDAVGTPVAVQQKMMRHSDIRTTFNVYGDVVTDEMATAGTKVAQLAFQSNGAQAERNAS